MIPVSNHFQMQALPFSTACLWCMIQCIRENVLREFLISDKERVIGMIFDEYNEDEQRKMDRRDAKEEGKAEGEAKALIQFLAVLGSVPEDLLTVIKAEMDIGKLDGWMTTAFQCKTIEEFREKAKI